MFSAVRGESRRAQAQQSDGDRGSHEENKGKKKYQTRLKPTHTPLLTCADCTMMEDRNVTLELHHTHTHNTKSVQLSDVICIEDIVTHALAGPRK